MGKKENSGVALYLVVVFVAIATSLLMIIYSKMSTTGISAINSANHLQEKMYLESASELLRNGYSDEEITKYVEQIGGSEIKVERETIYETTEDVSIIAIEAIEPSEDTEEIEGDYEGSYIIKMENSIWELHFSIEEGSFVNYYFKESE